MQSNMIFPDRLLESVVSIRITSLWASLAAASLMSHSLGVRSKILVDLTPLIVVVCVDRPGLILIITKVCFDLFSPKKPDKGSS